MRERGEAERVLRNVTWISSNEAMTTVRTVVGGLAKASAGVPGGIRSHPTYLVLHIWQFINAPYIFGTWISSTDEPSRCAQMAENVTCLRV